MKIAIAPFTSPFLDLFSNLANYLSLKGHSVVFLNPDLYLKHCLQKQGLRCEFYSKSQKIEEQYSVDSELIVYYANLYKVKDSSKLVFLKNKQFTFAKQYLANKTPDVVLFWNGQTSVERDVCTLLRIPFYCCENGYFPNTMQMQMQGINCNADIANLSLNEFLQFRYKQNTQILSHFKLSFFRQSTIQRMLFRVFDENYFIIMKEAFVSAKKERAAKKRFAAFEMEAIDDAALKPFIFFPLQVNSDTQIILNSPYKSMCHALESVLPALKSTGMRIVLKEHPYEVEPVDYSAFVDNKQVFLLKKCNLNKAIDSARFVVTINSSVGLQAIERYKKVLLLGKALYQHAPSAYSLQDRLQKIIDAPLDVQLVDHYINHFKEHVFLNGNWNDISVELIHLMCVRLTQNDFKGMNSRSEVKFDKNSQSISDFSV